jgi:hypothetical protein
VRDDRGGVAKRLPGADEMDVDGVHFGRSPRCPAAATRKRRKAAPCR